MRVVFFGTPDFAVPSLEALVASAHEVVGVVTQPDRPRGRGQRLTAGPVKQAALAHGLPVLQPDRLRDPAFVTAVEAWGPDVGAVAAYGRLIPDELLALPRHGMINVHASLLPRHRGAAPIHRAVLAGDTETGITIIRLVREMDAGPMLSRTPLPIGPDDTSAALERALATLGAERLTASLDDLETGVARFEEQDHAMATLAPRLTREDGVIDWSASADVIHNQVRGLHPWPHAFSYLQGRRLLLLRSSVVASPTPEAAPGEILVATGDDFIVAAGLATALAVRELQPEGKRRQEPRAFLAGHPLSPGTRFAPAPSLAT